MKPIPEYRDFLIKKYMKQYSNSTYEYWDKARQDKEFFYVDENNVLYTGGKEPDFLTAAHESDEVELLYGHTFADYYTTPIMCTCGSKSFNIIYTDSYETSAKCIKCGHQEVVASG